jgi:hypothetical protein
MKAKRSKNGKRKKPLGHWSHVGRPLQIHRTLGEGEHDKAVSVSSSLNPQSCRAGWHQEISKWPPLSPIETSAKKRQEGWVRQEPEREEMTNIAMWQSRPLSQPPPGHPGLGLTDQALGHEVYTHLSNTGQSIHKLNS